MTNSADEQKQTASQVRFRLVDPLGRAIEGLKYEIKQGTKTIAKGVTDAEGKVSQFASQVGSSLSVHVEHFTSGAMTQIKELTPWTELFSVKLVSTKVKEKTGLVPDQGDAGQYRRKTYVVQPHDTLDAIARKNGTSAQELAKLNSLRLTSVIYPGQVLKLPLVPGSLGSSTSAPARGKAGSASTPKSQTPAPAVSGSASSTVQTDRGANGSPKASATVTCQAACIKLGDKGPLIEELNVRLTGFGGTLRSPTPLNEFTAKTEAAVKQFQRDYMGVAETGKVCGSVLSALDEFRRKYPADLSAMKCVCGKCGGFGTNQTDSSVVKMYSDPKHKHPWFGKEYPGMHRSLLWALKAVRFYSESKDKDLGYSLFRISSGYRCWHDNAQHKRHSTNHMGNALDLQFQKNGTKCGNADIEKIRSEIFIKRLGAQMRWDERNRLSMESTADGATTWVHVDVREFDDAYKDARYYAVNQASCDGDPLIEVARREGRLPLINCGGLLPPAASAPPPAAGTQGEARLPIESLRLSQKGLDFIKGWEKCSLKPYDDSEGFCTIGWGHLIARKKCASLSKDELKPFTDGISQASADTMFSKDLEKQEDIVKEYVQVPLFQHEYDALVSLIFNLGGFKKCPKLLSKLNTKDYSGCCDEFADITNGGTSGLVKRRKAEMNIFRNAVYDSSH